jgi:hypothetical protein
MIAFDSGQKSPADYIEECYGYLYEFLLNERSFPSADLEAFRPFMAESRAREQVQFFDHILKAGTGTKA